MEGGSSDGGRKGKGVERRERWAVGEGFFFPFLGCVWKESEWGGQRRGEVSRW